MKKLLSILLTVVMLASVFVLPAGAFVPNREVTYTAGFSYVQDFSDVSKTDFTTGYGETGVASETEIVDGKAVYTPNPSNNVMTLVSDVEVSATSYTVEFDVSFNVDMAAFSADNGGYAIYFGTEQGSNPYAVELYPSGLKANTVRTYKFTVDTTFDATAQDTVRGMVAVQKKDAGESAFSSLEYRAACDGDQFRTYVANYSQTANTFDSLFISPNHQFTLGAREMNGKAPFTGALEITLDNIKIYKDGGALIGSNYATKVGVQYAFDGGSNTDRNPTWSQGYTWVLNREESGNMYCTLGAAEGNMHHVALDSLNGCLEKDKIFSFDVRREIEDAATLRILQYNSINGSDQYDKKLNIKLYNLTKDQWYSYKIDTKDGIATNAVKVYRKLRGEADSEYKLLTFGTDYADAGTGISANKAIYLSLMDVDTSKHLGKDHYSFDNVQIRDRVAYSGNLSNSEATLFVETDEASETVIMASYDGSVLKDVDFETLDGADNKAELSVTAGTANTQIFVWNNLLGGKPILTSPIEIAQ